LFTTPDFEKYISGVILFDETIRQTTVKGGMPFADYLTTRGVIPGIKVDKGFKEMPLKTGENITEGLDGLGKRLEEYFQLGARFAKWRAPLEFHHGPTLANMKANAWLLATYAAHCQQTQIVPIVEPEFIMEKGTHGIKHAYEKNIQMLKILFDALSDLDVMIEAVILKPSMVIPGDASDEYKTISPQKVAEMTVKAHQKTLPKNLPGVAFLSGGLNEINSTVYLNAISKAGKKMPWNYSFSYGRALQASVLKTWQGKSENVEAAQKIFQKRAKANWLTAQGLYENEVLI
jgi:fructose-bisphosphate aldolase class I